MEEDCINLAIMKLPYVVLRKMGGHGGVCVRERVCVCT